MMEHCIRLEMEHCVRLEIETLILIRFVWRLWHNVSTMRVVSLQRISCAYKTGP